MDWILFSIMLFEVKLLLKRGQFLFVLIFEIAKVTSTIQDASFLEEELMTLDSIIFI